MTTTIYSSSGRLIVNPTGKVVETIDMQDYNQENGKITKVDLSEYRRFYGVETENKHIDILDIGLFYENGHYEEPDHEWRKETIELRKNNQ